MAKKNNSMYKGILKSIGDAVIGVMFLLLFLVTAPLNWLTMQLFGLVCKFHNWVSQKLMDNLNNFR